jgi:hypothetical protein
MKLLNVFRESKNGAPRDLETIIRSAKREFLGLDSRSSEPFLSGDSFKYRMSYIFEGMDEPKPSDFHDLHEQEVSIFAQAGPMSRAAFDILTACEDGVGFQNAKLYIHNGDEIPPSVQMLQLVKNFKSVSSINWLGDPHVVRPLPIGLENRDKRRNGVPRDYLAAQKKGLPPFPDRDIQLLVCFSLHTNREERELAWKAGIKVPGAVVVNHPITPKKYRDLVLRSKFVLSPPGNGPDCHRTWEAMYLGAIPVVKESSWPFRHLNLPVHVVSNWENLDLAIPEVAGDFFADWKNINYWLLDK